MSERTAIEWATSTFNPWIGCTKIAPPCDNCYAETLDHRWGGDHWGPGKKRRLTSDANWREPLKWNRAAAGGAKPWRVFCASLADVFDNEVDPTWRERLFKLITETPHLTWMLLTKRIGNVRQMVPSQWLKEWPPSVWLLITVGDQSEADRDIPKLQAFHQPLVRGLSMEPLLGPISIGEAAAPYPGINWVITGGESGRHARPMHPEWVRAIRNDCVEAGVAFFFKQWGEWVHFGHPKINYDGARPCYLTSDGQRFEECHDGKFGVQLRDDRPHLQAMYRVGKKAAGRELDGRKWDEFPQGAVAA